MKDVIDEVFVQVMELLIEEGLVHLQDYFLDGTKIESKMSSEQKQERGYYQKEVLNSVKNDVQSLKVSLDK